MVVSPKNLWLTYDRKAAPLNVAEISTTSTSFGVEKKVYFDGEAAENCFTRIYARLLKVNDGKKLVLVLKAPQDDINNDDFSSFTNRGWSVLAVDYAGNSFGEKERFTIYPNQLEFANYDEEKLYASTDSPNASCQYIWTTIALRAVTFAESEGFERIAMLGVGIGGAQVFRACAITDVPKCGVSLFSPGFYPPADDINQLSGSVGLDVAGYAPLLKTPFYQLCCSNDADSSLDDINSLNEQAPNDAIMYIAARVGRSLTTEIQANIDKFMSVYLDSVTEAKSNLNMPEVTISGSENKMYFSLTCNEQPAEARVYVSHGITNASYRNWRKIPMQMAGEREYIGYTEVYSLDKPVYAFGTVLTNSGFLISSNVVKKTPSSINVTPTTIFKRRLIYDVDMGLDDFFTDGRIVKPVIKPGPFGINGICVKNNLCTYKIGDVAYSGERDGSLQLLLFSPVPQKVKFSVTDGDQFLTHVCEKAVSPENDWSKVTLAVSDLKSSDSNLFGWDRAIFLRIDTEEELLINSLLWV